MAFARAFEILLDGQTAAALRRGHEATVQVSAGHHTVRARLNWLGSQTVDLDLAEHDQAHITCRPAFRLPVLIWPWALFYAVFVRRNRFIDLQLRRVESAR